MTLIKSMSCKKLVLKKTLVISDHLWSRSGNWLHSRQQVVQLPHVKLLNQHVHTGWQTEGFCASRRMSGAENDLLWPWMYFPITGDASSRSHPVCPANSCELQAPNTLCLMWGSGTSCTWTGFSCVTAAPSFHFPLSYNWTLGVLLLCNSQTEISCPCKSKVKAISFSGQDLHQIRCLKMKFNCACDL